MRILVDTEEWPRRVAKMMVFLTFWGGFFLIAGCLLFWGILFRVMALVRLIDIRRSVDGIGLVANDGR